ncbi:MAG: helix-turn-helix domain-containing protein [Alphaproteobacteria bacterium]|nr:helix-turn-helix domain-containing protein [Alphaproteobacteria bacterium]
MSRQSSPSRRPSTPPSSTAEEQQALLGRRIADLRAALGQERPNLARRVGITPSRLKRIEDGTGRLEASLLYALARALNVTVAELFEDASHLSRAALDPEGRNLMRFFGTIQDASIRRSILKLAKALSEKP